MRTHYYQITLTLSLTRILVSTQTPTAIDSNTHLFTRAEQLKIAIVTSGRINTFIFGLSTLALHKSLLIALGLKFSEEMIQTSHMTEVWDDKWLS